MPVEVPCGRCMACRLEKKRNWAVRNTNESLCWDDNCFITLTYNDDYLIENNPFESLMVEDMQKFMKRLRKHEQGTNTIIHPRTKKKYNPIRHFYCGEYGEKTNRPHWHALLFNYDFDDKEIVSEDKGYTEYYSEKLQRLWSDKNGPIGRVHIGDVTFDSCSYVSGYIVKKVTGEWAEHQYQIIDPESGEVVGQKIPEFQNMSRDPGIGYYYYERFGKDIYKTDSIVVKGKEIRPPKYYDKKFESEQPKKLEDLKRARKKAINKLETTYERLRVKEEVQKKKFDFHNTRKL